MAPSAKCGTLNRRYASIPIHAGDLDTPGTVAYAMKQIIAAPFQALNTRKDFFSSISATK